MHTFLNFCMKYGDPKESLDISKCFEYIAVIFFAKWDA